jgi:hypothetical protein
LFGSRLTRTDHCSPLPGYFNGDRGTKSKPILSFGSSHACPGQKRAWCGTP